MNHLISTPAAAKILGISPTTLREHAVRGDIPCIPIGHGEVRKRRMFDPADIQDFINRRREREACPSIKTSAAPTTNTTSSVGVYDFMARRAALRAEKQSDLKQSGRNKLSRRLQRKGAAPP